MIALVQAALSGVDRTDREAFLLYGMEGFSLSEIARSLAGIQTRYGSRFNGRASVCAARLPWPTNSPKRWLPDSNLGISNSEERSR